MSIYSNYKKKLVLLGDILLVFSAFFLAAYIKVIASQAFSFETVLSKANWVVVSWIFLCPVIFYVFELYDESRWQRNVRLLSHIVFAVLITAVIMAFLSFLFLSDIVIGRKIILLYILFVIPFLFCWRKFFFRVFLQNGANQQKILLIGENPIIEDLKSLMPNSDAGVLTTICDYSENPGTIRINGSKSTKSLSDFVIESQTNTVVVADRLKNLPLLRKELLDLRFAGVAIYDAPLFYETLTGKVPVTRVTDSWFLFRNQGDIFNPAVYRKIKKIIDKVFALIGIILTFPMMLLAALAIKLTSKGPAFFKQERLSQNEQPFTLIKFRTMIDNAEKLTGPKWASEDDPRITRVGRFLRKSRLDELPQFFNVLKGDMSFVGPRPIRKQVADMLAKEFPYYRLRFTVKPGLSGWAQVRGDYAGSKEGQFEKLQYDLYYVQNQSILFDLFIILKTVQTVLFRRGT
jgi:exopolysaccharide biosynthesis polyprenyl glycosylphosphotransferase